MDTSLTRLTLLLLALAVAVLFAAMVAFATAVLSRLDGARPVACVERGAVTFLATLTVCVATLSLMVTAL
ncbi:hypothetical protein [Embleya hyalina]|uniref:Uncharacterized protein n=1 Tax=Embleya hyalina TaxID=516124 RepID=A0A401YYJ0_9ACTN|nr:hypothetical protein [Embleya hyalina]GCD99689.1 hypothetical protein EHYA_07411 [Embleya hyalina]